MEPTRTRGGTATALLAVGLLALLAGVVLGILVGSDGSDDAGPPATLAPTQVDIGFLQDMLDHHAQIVRLSEHAIAAGEDPAVKELAYAIVADQQREIGAMEALLADRGEARGAPDRTVMGWMLTPVAFEDMDGLVPEDDVIAYLNLRGAELDRRFLEMTLYHHEGGIHMAEYAADHATSAEVRDLAARMVVSQNEEIADLEGFLAGAGIPVDGPLLDGTGDTTPTTGAG